MKQLLKDIVKDQKAFLSNRKTIARYFPEQHLHNELVVIVTGIRRCGKSVLLQQIRAKQPQKDYFFNFDDDRLSNFKQDNFQDLYEVFIELYGEQDYFYFDEIQNIAGWEHFVKRLYNLGKKVFITGSNARMLSRELGTLLTGCYVAIELYPFSFAEFLFYHGKNDLLSGVNGTAQRAEIEKMFARYLREGGIPLYLQSGDVLVLKTLYENILYRDVMVRNQLTGEAQMKELVYYVMSNISKPITYTSLAKVIGVSNPTTVKNYLEYIENTYLLFSVSKLDWSVKTQMRNPKKIYAIDNALVGRLGFHFSREEGRLLENLVHLELRRQGKEIYYYHTGKEECDFVVRNGFGVETVIQVCFSFETSIIRERELAGLLAAMREYQLTEGYVLTGSYEEELKLEEYFVHIMPVWKWLLKSPGTDNVL